jgi:type VI secretion system protein ImpC
MTELLRDTQPQTSLSEDANAFASLLLQEFKPKTERAREAVETAVRTLAEQALAQTDLVSNDAITSIESIIAAIDAKLTAQVNQVIHHPDFQQLESAWRGLHYLVNNTESDEQLKIRVLNISKPELHKTLKKFKGTAWDQSPLFKKMYEEEYGQFGGEQVGQTRSQVGVGGGVRVVVFGGFLQGLSANERPVHCRRIAHCHGHGILAGTVQPTRPDQDFHHP